MLGEDFDKAGISTATIEALFVTYANIFKDLKLHLIFNVPITLYNSCAGNSLAFSFENSLIIPDTTVFHQNHSPNVQGRKALFELCQI